MEAVSCRPRRNLLLLFAGAGLQLFTGLLPTSPAFSALPAESGGGLNLGFEDEAYEPDPGVIPNHDFAQTGGGVPGWQVQSGTATILNGRLELDGGSVISDSFTIPSDSQVLSLEVDDLTNPTPGTSLDIKIVTGGTEDKLGTTVRAPRDRRDLEFNITEYQGATVQLRLVAGDPVAFDDIRIWVKVPHWNLGEGETDVPAVYENGPLGKYVQLDNFIITSSPLPGLEEAMFWYRKFTDALNGTTGDNKLEIHLTNEDGSDIGAFQLDGQDFEADLPGGWDVKRGVLTNFVKDNYYLGGRTRIKVIAVDSAAVDFVGPGDVEKHQEYIGDPVNSTTGALHHQHTDVAVPGRGLPLQFTRFYNSQGGGTASSLGPHWSHSYDIKLHVVDDDSSGVVIVEWPGGYAASYRQVAGVFEPQDGAFDAVVLNQDGTYSLTTREKVKYNFSSSGTLTSVVDRNSNTTSLAYDTSGRLSTVTDPGGREFSLAYETSFDTGGLARGVPVAPFANADFEVRDYSNWTAAGTAFGTVPTLEDGLSYHAASVTGDEAATGTLTSASFKAGNSLHFRLGGSDLPTTVYAALVVSGSEVLTGAPDGDDDLDEFTLDTSQYAGQSVTVKLVDNSTIGHLRFDNLEVVYGNRLTSITAPLAVGTRRTVGFDYDAAGQLVEVTDVAGGTTEYTYGRHGLETLTDSNGHVATTSVYDRSGRVRKQTDAVGGVTCFYYGWGPLETDAACPGVTPAPTDGRVVVVNPRGYKTTYVMDQDLRTIQMIDNAGNTVDYDYNADNQLTCIKDGRNNRTRLEYDSAGNLTKMYDAANTNSSCAAISGAVSWTLTYVSGTSNVDTITDPLGRVTDLGYDAAGNVNGVEVKTSGSGTVVYKLCITRASTGLPTELTLSTSLSPPACTGNTTKLEYDSKGNVTGVVDPRFSSAGTPKTVITYDDGGRPLTVTKDLVNESDEVTTLTWNAKNQLLTATDNLANVTTYTYDAKGNLKTVKDARNRTTSFNYDEADRLVEVVDALIHDTDYTYDSNDNLTAVTNAKDKTTTYAYNSLDRLTSVTDPLSRATSYLYDANGNVTRRTDARNLITNYTWDALNRLLTIAHPSGGTPNVIYTYDAVGNRNSMKWGPNTTTYGYDALNRLTRVGPSTADDFNYSYDNPGNLSRVEYPDGKTVDYSYDAAGNLTSVTDWLNKVTSYTYNEAGRLTAAELPNGAKTTYTYDAAGWLDKLTNLDSATPANVVSSFDYTRDAVGNARWIKDKNGVNELYLYDNLYRLIQAKYRDGTEVNYEYDHVGNRTEMEIIGGATTTYSYDDADQLTSAGGVTYTYDNNGNLTGRGSDSFSYDHENRLTSATVGGTTSTNSYNGDGLRTSQTVGTTTNYTWDVNRGLPVIVQDGTKSYVYGLQRISLTTTSGGRNYFLHDGLGSVREVLNNVGTTPTATYEYDVFGAVRSSTTPGTNYWRFAGEQSDSATGLYYLRARHYDGAAGRFLTQDIWPGLLALPQTQAPYTYVANNPTAFTDPSGLCPMLGLCWPGFDPLVELVCGVAAGTCAAAENPTVAGILAAADLIPIAELCFASGVLAASTPACQVAEVLIGFVSGAANGLAIWAGNCNVPRKVRASIYQLASFALDFSPRGEATEYYLFLATNEATNCPGDWPGRSLGARWGYE